MLAHARMLETSTPRGWQIEDIEDNAACPHMLFPQDL